MKHGNITLGQLVRCLPEGFNIRHLDEIVWTDTDIGEVLDAAAEVAMESGRLKECANGSIIEHYEVMTGVTVIRVTNGRESFSGLAHGESETQRVLTDLEEKHDN